MGLDWNGYHNVNKQNNDQNIWWLYYNEREIFGMCITLTYTHTNTHTNTHTHKHTDTHTQQFIYVYNHAKSQTINWYIHLIASVHLEVVTVTSCTCL
jgi:carbohydrate-binding DOMON domain-containing protein